MKPQGGFIPENAPAFIRDLAKPFRLKPQGGFIPENAPAFIRDLAKPFG